MVLPTIYCAGDRIRATMAIGKLELKLIGQSSYQMPNIFPSGSLGQVISAEQGNLVIYLEDAAGNVVHRVILPLGVRGKIEKYDHAKSWC